MLGSFLCGFQFDKAGRLVPRRTRAARSGEANRHNPRVLVHTSIGAAALVARALERIRAEFNSDAKAHVFGALKPFLTGGVGLPSHESVAKHLDMPIDTVRSHLSRLRARYRAFVREEVARTIGPADDVEEELRQLRRILTATS